MTAKFFLILGSLNAMLTVILGAFGAHALKNRLSPELLGAYDTAAQYHFYHALGLLFVGVLLLSMPQNTLIKYSGLIMFFGILLFSGSLYALAISGIKGIGIITPFGGLCFIAAWLLLAVGVWKDFSIT